jgi:hypothetical protein
VAEDAHSKIDGMAHGIAWDMPVDDDSAAIRRSCSGLTRGSVGGDPGVFSGRARPVVTSGSGLAVLDEDDDAGREWFRLPRGGDVEGDREGPGGRAWPMPEDERRSRASLVAHCVVVVVLALPATLIVAFGIALAAR